MIIFGNINSFPVNCKENLMPVNFTGMSENIDRISTIGLETIDINDPDFDKKFAEIMYNNDDNFISLFDIIQLLNSGYDIYVCISSGQILDFLNESLAKFIQQRYGYNYQMINEVDDIDWYDDSSFSTTGLYNYDIDRDRYIKIMTNRGIIVPSREIY